MPRGSVTLRLITLSVAVVACALVRPLARGHGLVAAATLLWLRIPALAFCELNPDESEDVANALTLVADPRFGLSAECADRWPAPVTEKMTGTCGISSRGS